MGLRLALYLGLLILGSIIGYKDKVSGKLEENLDKIQNICLLFLLFVMGITIGMNEQVVNNLLSIGMKAVVISIMTILFSIIFVKLIAKYIISESDKIES